MPVDARPTIDEAKRSLREVFGYRGFRSGQAEVISAALAGQDALAIMPTGAGKSLCYQLPAILLRGTTLVISPLIALMKDQVDVLLAEGRARAACLNSSIEASERRQILRRMIDGGYDIVYVAPERLRSRSFRAALQQTPLALLVIDEAHCISEWGHDFRPDYLHIADAFEGDDRPPILAVTATATPKVQDDVRAQLGMSKAPVLAVSIDRPNLAFTVRAAPSLAAKYAAVQALLPARGDDAAIIYCGTRAHTEEVAEYIRTILGVSAVAYHAGMPNDERTRAQDSFMNDETPVVAATTAFGMGIDKDNIRCVIHFAMPGSLEAYYQQAGRAGRDGEQAHCTLLYCPDDRSLLEYFIRNSRVELDDLQRLWDAIWNLSSRQGSGSEALRISPAALSAISDLKAYSVTRAIELLSSIAPMLRLPDINGDLVLCLQAERLSREVLKAIDHHMNTSMQARQEQLTAMVHYAQTTTCRRRELLAHFGEELADHPEFCCDCCQDGATPVGDVTTEEHLALRCVDEMQWSVGRMLLADILRGSEARQILDRKLNSLSVYSALGGMDKGLIVSCIDGLLIRGLLKSKGADRPTVVLTPAGKQMLTDIASGARQVSQSPLAPPAQRPRLSTTSVGRRSEPQYPPETIQAAILVAVRELPYPLGRLRIAEILRGSSSKWLLEDGLEELASHGACEGESRDLIVAQIDALLAQGLLQSMGQLRPVVGLTPEGEARCSSAASDGAKPAQSAVGEAARFLNRAHPQRLKLASVDVGYSMDANSRFRGDEWQRTQLGELLYELKYRHRVEVAEEIAGRIESFLRDHDDLGAPDLLIGVPPTESRQDVGPVEAILARLAERGYRVADGLLERGRPTRKQKEIEAAAQKQANIAGAIRLTDANAVSDRRVLVIDDIVDSGATLNECARVLRKAGATSVCALVVTRTIHHAG